MPAMSSAAGPRELFLQLPHPNSRRKAASIDVAGGDIEQNGLIDQRMLVTWLRQDVSREAIGFQATSNFSSELRFSIPHTCYTIDVHENASANLREGIQELEGGVR